MQNRVPRFLTTD